VGTFNIHSNCNVVLLYYFNLNDEILLIDCLDVCKQAKITMQQNNVMLISLNWKYAIYMPIRVLFTHRITKYGGKILL